MASAASICGKQVLLSPGAELVDYEQEAAPKTAQPLRKAKRDGPKRLPPIVVEIYHSSGDLIFETVILHVFQDGDRIFQDGDEEEGPLTTIGDLRTALGQKLGEVARSYEMAVAREVDHWFDGEGAVYPRFFSPEEETTIVWFEARGIVTRVVHEMPLWLIPERQDEVAITEDGHLVLPFRDEPSV